MARGNSARSVRSPPKTLTPHTVDESLLVQNNKVAIGLRVPVIIANHMVESDNKLFDCSAYAFRAEWLHWGLGGGIVVSGHLPGLVEKTRCHAKFAGLGKGETDESVKQLIWR